MNSRNYHDSFSEDDAFLQNFEVAQDSPDILEHLCKQQQPKIQNIEKQEEYEEQMDEEYGQSHLKPERKKSGRSKDKKKIFYRDKMAELMKPGEYIKQQYNYVAFSQLEQGKVPISKDQQLKRNRQSAKNSRQRKKQYITILERKNQENSKLIEQLKQQLEQVTFERDRLKQDNHQQIKNFLKSKAEAYEKLQNVTNNPLSSSEQIKHQIDYMLERFSASGCERIAVMNYYMNQIIEDLISDIHKYFLNSSAFSQGFTPSNPPKNIDLEVMKILGLDITKMSQLIHKYKERFTKQASVFKNLTQQFYRVFKSIENQSKIIELIFIDMIKEIDSKKVAQLILWFEQNQFCRQIKRVRKQWTDQLVTGEQVVEVIRKQAKHF